MLLWRIAGSVLTVGNMIAPDVCFLFCQQGEADLAAALFFELRKELLMARHQKKEGLKPTRVGVITPYRQQRKCLQDTFAALCAENAKEVSFLYLFLSGTTKEWSFCRVQVHTNLAKIV